MSSLGLLLIGIADQSNILISWEYISIIYHMPMYETLTSRQAWSCCYLELLDQLQKQIYRTVGSPLAASLEPLVHLFHLKNLFRPQDI